MKTRMRVIAGTYRSRPLAGPRGTATRPTSDRLRETLFNVLVLRIEGAAFADLYAGSGAVGIEALSRGARQVCFVENAPPALAAIRANLASLKIHAGYSIEARSVSAVLKQFAQLRPDCQWDLVFLDPPYRDADSYTDTLETLAKYASALLAQDAIVIVEHDSRAQIQAPLAEDYGPLRRYRVLKQGDASLSFYRIPSPEETAASGGG